MQTASSLKINKTDSISPDEAENAIIGRASQIPMVAPRFESKKVYDPTTGLPIHEEAQREAFDYKKYQE